MLKPHFYGCLTITELIQIFVQKDKIYIIYGIILGIFSIVHQCKLKWPPKAVWNICVLHIIKYWEYRNTKFCMVIKAQFWVANKKIQKISWGIPRSSPSFLALFFPRTSSHGMEFSRRVRNEPFVPHVSKWGRSPPRFIVSIPVEESGSLHKLRGVAVSSSTGAWVEW